jgi:hypothetical protein
MADDWRCGNHCCSAPDRIGEEWEFFLPHRNVDRSADNYRIDLDFAPPIEGIFHCSSMVDFEKSEFVTSKHRMASLYATRSMHARHRAKPPELRPAETRRREGREVTTVA